MQGNPDRPVAVGAASIVYEDLLAAGVKIFEYMKRPLHAKVAVIDAHWARSTVRRLLLTFAYHLGRRMWRRIRGDGQQMQPMARRSSHAAE